MNKPEFHIPLPDLRPGKALYVQVADAIAEHIKANSLKPGDRLPSQSSLMKTYSVSQATVRQALLNLSNRGLARAEHGRGVFVDEPHLALSVETPAILDRDNQRQKTTQFELVQSESIFAPERVAKALHVEEGTQIIRMRRILRSDMRMIGLETSNLTFNAMQALTKDDLSSRSIEEAFLQHENLKVSRSQLKISAGPISAFDADLLRLSAETTTLQKEEIFFNADNTPVLMQRTVLVARNVDLITEIKR
jgi:GntR family trehalose operon transcriptional repressor